MNKPISIVKFNFKEIIEIYKMQMLVKSQPLQFKNCFRIAEILMHPDFSQEAFKVFHYT